MPLIGFLGGQELLIIALILLVLFGGTRIPSLMRGMGQGIREFRKELGSGSSSSSKEDEGDEPASDDEPAKDKETKEEK